MPDQPLGPRLRSSAMAYGTFMLSHGVPLSVDAVAERITRRFPEIVLGEALRISAAAQDAVAVGAFLAVSEPGVSPPTEQIPIDPSIDGGYETIVDVTIIPPYGDGRVRSIIVPTPRPPTIQDIIDAVIREIPGLVDTLPGGGSVEIDPNNPDQVRITIRSIIRSSNT